MRALALVVPVISLLELPSSRRILRSIRRSVSGDTMWVQLSCSDSIFQSSALVWVGAGTVENGGVNSETTS